MCDVQKLNFPVNVLTFGLKAKNFKFINYSLVETAHARCVWLLWKKPFYCPTLFPGYLGSGERETLGTRLANVEHLNHNSTLFRATRKNIIFNFWSLMRRPLYMNSTVFNFEKNNSHITCKKEILTKCSRRHFANGPRGALDVYSSRSWHFFSEVSSFVTSL